MRVTIGADPEFFLKKDGVNVAAVGLVPGTKAKPHPFLRGAVQLDGTAVEFNIKPALTELGFVTNIKSTLWRIRRMVPKEYKFDYSPTAEYEKKYFDTLPDDSKELGCDPDFNAYQDGKENPRPNNKTTMRTGAGHIHVGWGKDLKGEDHKFDCIQLTKLMDDFLYPYSALWDKDQKRQKLYGKPGAFRPKSYGFEYRTLSNAWLNYPKLWPFIHRTAKLIPKLAEEGRFVRYNRGVSIYEDIKYYSMYLKDWKLESSANYIKNNLAKNYGIDAKKLPDFPLDFAT